MQARAHARARADALVEVDVRMDRHLDDLVAEGDEPTVLNYHGFAAEILRRHGMRIGH